MKKAVFLAFVAFLWWLSRGSDMENRISHLVALLCFGVALCVFIPRFDLKKGDGLSPAGIVLVIFCVLSALTISMVEPLNRGAWEWRGKAEEGEKSLRNMFSTSDSKKNKGLRRFVPGLSVESTDHQPEESAPGISLKVDTLSKNKDPIKVEESPSGGE